MMVVIIIISAEPGQNGLLLIGAWLQGHGGVDWASGRLIGYCCCRATPAIAQTVSAVTAASAAVSPPFLTRPPNSAPVWAVVECDQKVSGMGI